MSLCFNMQIQDNNLTKIYRSNRDYLAKTCALAAQGQTCTALFRSAVHSLVNEVKSH